MGHLSGMGEEAAVKSLKDPVRSVRERLKSWLEVLKASRILMVWDGLELDGKTGKISDPDLAEFYLQMLKGMTAGRAIITCRAMPADALTLPARAWQWKLEGLGKAAFIRYLLQDGGLADRYKKGEITYALLAEHHRAALGHPARLAQTGKALGLGDLAANEDPLAKLISRLGSASCSCPLSGRGLQHCHEPGRPGSRLRPDRRADRSQCERVAGSLVSVRCGNAVGGALIHSRLTPGGSRFGGYSALRKRRPAIFLETWPRPGAAQSWGSPAWMSCWKRVVTIWQQRIKAMPSM